MIKDLICCPCDNCKSTLIEKNDFFQCSNLECVHNKIFFSKYKNLPLLISFNNSNTICRKEDYLDTKNKDISFSQINRNELSIKTLLRRLIFGTSETTKKNIEDFMNEVSMISDKPKVLVIGSGEKGKGTNNLWNSNFQMFGIDIYASPSTNIIADAHYLPFKNESFDAVLIQAVLEHLIDPIKTVDEISRVLVKDGLVYSEVPFMQQVHEGAYDFQRYTVLGHRYLFKDFALIKMGGNKGAGIALAWSIKYFVWSIFRSKKIAILLQIPFFVIFRFLEIFSDRKSLWDSSSGVFFLGKKDGTSITAKDIPSLYKGFQK